MNHNTDKMKKELVDQNLFQNADLEDLELLQNTDLEDLELF